MDILKKLFASKQSTEDDVGPNNNKSQFPPGTFKKPWWFDEFDKDEEIFGKKNPFNFSVTITDPNEMQRYFESVIQEAFKSIDGLDEQMPVFEDPQRFIESGLERDMTPMFEDKEIEPHKALKEIDSAMRSFYEKSISEKPITTKEEISEYEQVMNLIHGCAKKPEEKPAASRRYTAKSPAWHKHHPHFRHHQSPVVPPNFSGQPSNPHMQMYGKSIMTSIKRMPDGSYETEQTVRDADGTTQVTRTRTVDGKTEVLEKSVNGANQMETGVASESDSARKNSTESNSSIFTIRNGYIMPINMW